MDTSRITTLTEEKVKFFKIVGLVLFVLFTFLHFSSFLSLELLLLIAVFPLFYWGFKDRLWIPLLLALPALILGEIVVVPITSTWGYEARLSEILLGLSFVVFLLDRFLNVEKTDTIKMDKPAFLLFALLVLSTLSFYYIEDFRFFIVGSKVAFFSFAGYFLALNSFNDRRSVQWFLRGIALTVFLISGQILVKFYQMGFSTKFFFERGQIEIPLGPIALVSAFLAFLLPIMLALYFSREGETNKKKMIYLAVFFLGGLAVFLSLGKAAIFSLGLGLFYLFIKLPKKRMKFVAVGGVAAGLALIFFHSFFTGLGERIARTFVSENTQFRITEYKVGWSIIKDNFLLGVGTGQQLFHYQRLLEWDQPQLVNNYLLHALLEWGIIGATLLISILVASYKKIKIGFKNMFNPKNGILVHGFAAAFLVVVVNGLAEATIFTLPYAIAFWLSWGVLGNFNESFYS